MMGYERPGPCQHPQVSDFQLVERERIIRETWGAASEIRCPDCSEYLFPDGDSETGTVYFGAPRGSGGEL